MEITRKHITLLMIIPAYYLYQQRTNSQEIQFNQFNPMDISCHIKPESVLRLVNKNFINPNNTNSIFFVETSCYGGLNSRQACAVESAARANPSWRTTVLFAGPLSEQFTKGSIFKMFPKKFNIGFLRIKVEDFAKGTPLEELLLKGLQNSIFPVEHSSDVLRILTLYKYGGLYLDLDMIVMKNFETLPPNFVAKQNDDSLSSGVLAFSSHGIGKGFLETAIRELANTYNPNTWEGNGPKLIERTLRKICVVKDVRNMNYHMCNGFHVLDSKWFYPIDYSAWQVYFLDYQPEPNDAYTHHVWNHKGFATDVPENSFYAHLAKKYCPYVHDLYGDEFGS